MCTLEVRTAVLEDIDRLRDLEAKAALIFRDVDGLQHFADGEPSMSIEQQIELVTKAGILVICDSSSRLLCGVDEPAGFISVDVVDECLHIFEISVAPQFQRRGLSARLIDAAVEMAKQRGVNALSLTTDRFVPWNAPMYAKRGFVETEASKLGLGHVKIVEHEERDGLDLSRRCTMVRRLH